MTEKQTNEATDSGETGDEAPAKRFATSFDLQAEYEESHIQDTLDELDRELVGLEPVKARIREIAALLLVSKARREVGLETEPPHASYVVYRQSRHRQDHRWAAYGGYSS
jgi:hypothetical protein